MKSFTHNFIVSCVRMKTVTHTYIITLRKKRKPQRKGKTKEKEV